MLGLQNALKHVLKTKISNFGWLRTNSSGSKNAARWQFSFLPASLYPWKVVVTLKLAGHKDIRRIGHRETEQNKTAERTTTTFSFFHFHLKFIYVG